MAFAGCRSTCSPLLHRSSSFSSSSFLGARPLQHHRPRLLRARSSLTRPSGACVCTIALERVGVGMDEVAISQRPDAFGRFGKFGGKYVPETLMFALTELESAFRSLASDDDFQKELDGILKDYVGRESPLYFAERLSDHYKCSDGTGPHIYLKREDLNHTGAHKINNAVAQALLAKRLGKKRIIAETGAGQHGVATATVCARFGLDCVVYMGAQDMERQALNVFRMRLLGAEVRAVHAGTATLKDATSEAIRDWVTNVETTHYILGSVAGPHPYPMMVREFHSVIGKETRRQAMEKWGGKPDILVACVGGGSNAMGLFHEFIEDPDVRLIGVEAAGFGLDSGKHAATLSKGEVGVLHGAMCYLLQDEEGQIIEPHSISAGLDYPGVGPEHSYLKDIGRAEYYSVTDQEALDAITRFQQQDAVGSSRGHWMFACHLPEKGNAKKSYAHTLWFFLCPAALPPTILLFLCYSSFLGFLCFLFSFLCIPLFFVHTFIEQNLLGCFLLICIIECLHKFLFLFPLLYIYRCVQVSSFLELAVSYRHVVSDTLTLIKVSMQHRYS